MATHGDSVADPARGVFRNRLVLLVVIFGILAYLAFLTAIAATAAPDYDEALVGNPAYNLARHGFMGTTNLYRPGWPGIERYTLNTLPGSIILTALVFRFTNASALAVRVVPMAFAIIGLVSIYGIVAQLTGSRGRAWLAVLLVALDYHYILDATNAHPDMMQVSLGLSAQAAYLYLRRRNLNLAILAGCTLVACAVLTHPNAIFSAIFFAVLVVWLDWGGLSWRSVFAGALPFVAGFAGWYQYFSRAPVGARAQLASNAGVSYDVFSFLQRPIYMLRGEIQVRYLRTHSLRGIFLLYVASVLAVFLWREARRDRATRFFVAQALVTGAFFAFCQGVKDIYGYTADVTPFLLMAASGILYGMWTRHRRLAWIAACLVVCADCVALTGFIRLIADNPNRNTVVAATDFLRAAARPSDLLALPPQWGFSYGFDAKSVQWDNRFRTHPKFVAVRAALASPEGINQLLTDFLDEPERPAAKEFFQNAEIVFRTPPTVIFRRLDTPSRGSAQAAP